MKVFAEMTEWPVQGNERPEEVHIPVVPFKYIGSKFEPGDILVNNKNYCDGAPVEYAYHCNREYLDHRGEYIQKCPYCHQTFWVPEGCRVHPSCKGWRR